MPRSYRARMAFRRTADGATRRRSCWPRRTTSRKIDPAAGARGLPGRVDPRPCSTGRLAGGGRDETGGGHRSRRPRHPIRARRTYSSTDSPRSLPTGRRPGRPRVQVAVAVARAATSNPRSPALAMAGGSAAGLISVARDGSASPITTSGQPRGWVARGAGAGSHDALRRPSIGGRHTGGGALIEEADGLARATGGGVALGYGGLGLAAHRGREDERLRLARIAAAGLRGAGRGAGRDGGDWVTRPPVQRPRTLLGRVHGGGERPGSRADLVRQVGVVRS